MSEKNIRQRQEEREHETLSPYAAFSDKSRGRDIKEVPCDIRPIYQRDRDRILHSKAFRRLKHKTQVFLAPEGDHYRTRLTHTLEVAQTARTIAKALRLNEDLTEAIALGHDLGHTPFGHAGERALNDICENGFEHHLQSLRVVELLEKDGEGLNLTWEVRDGIKNHQSNGNPSTLEGKIVRLADKIAYVNHDIDDAIRGHVLTEEELPKEYTNPLGHNSRERLNTLIHDIILNSEGTDDVKMSQDIRSKLYGLRAYLFQTVYKNSKAKSEETKAIHMIEQLYQYYLNNLAKLPVEYIRMMEIRKQTKEQTVCDYIAGMTDRYAIVKFKEIFVPGVWSVY